MARWKPTDREDAKKSLNEGLDTAAAVLGGGEAKNLRSRERDSTAIRVLPRLVLVCIAATFAITVLRKNYDFWEFVNSLCTVFALAFALVGVWAIRYMDRGPFPTWALMAASLVAVMVAWTIFSGTSDVLYLRGVEAYQDVDPEYRESFRVLDFLITLFILAMAPMGVLTTVCAMLRKYIPRVLLSVERGNRKGKNPAARFFGVPKIVDVERVEVEQADDGHAVDLNSHLWMGTYMFMLGILICSMLFLNPVVLETVPDYLIIRAMITLSLFLPAMVVPWLTIRSTGAKVISVAPRPYYLWIGARQKLFMGFATLGLFFFSFLVSVYYGNSVGTMLSYYARYVVPLAAITLVSSLIYGNYFSKGLRDDICEEFNREKGQEA